MKEQDILTERMCLAVERLSEICRDSSGEQPSEGFSENARECLGDQALEAYFAFCADFLLLMHETYLYLQAGGQQGDSVLELARRNKALYADILPEHYEKSYGNPAYAVRKLGWERGRELCFLYTELRSMIAFVYEGRLEEVVIRMELFLEVYAAFVYAASAGEELPGKAELRQMLYWFVSDYADVAADRSMKEQLCPQDCFGVKMIQCSDLEDVRYLYGYGEYVGEEELRAARYMAGLSQEAVNLMADAYTERFCRGALDAGVDLTQKSTVALSYRLGFERMMRRVIENFGEMGLKPVICRAAGGLDNSGACNSGFYGGIPNRQFAYDHKDDNALFLDKNYVNRSLQAMRAACDKYRLWAVSCAGPAAMETLEEADFKPAAKREALRLTKEQNRLLAEYRARAEELRHEYGVSTLMPGRL